MLCVFCSSRFEAEMLLSKMKDYKKIIRHQLVFYELTLNRKKLLLVQAGEGKVNLAYAVGMMMEKYPITAMIGFGNCGYIGKKERMIGDIAISNTVFQYDVDFQANQYRLFEIPGMNQVVYSTDNGLKQFALMAGKYLKYKTYLGIFGTADRFINSQIISEHLNESYQIEFIDVQSAVLGQLSYLHHIPFISIKAISHYGDDLAFEIFKESFQKANQQASDVVYIMLEAMTRKNVYC